jgi:hypothetical protein
LATANAKAFDDAHDDDPAYLTSTNSHLGDFVQWAWGLKTLKVPRTDYRTLPARTPRKMHHPQQQPQHFYHTTNPSPGTPAHLRSQYSTDHERCSCQSDEAKTQNKLLSRQLEHKNLYKEEKKKDRFKNYTPPQNNSSFLPPPMSLTPANASSKQKRWESQNRS